MTTSKASQLYDLLPAVYREQDAEDYPLRALLAIIGEQADLVENDIRRLWDDLFIETCQPWVIPYIGELVSNDLLYDTSRIRGDDTATGLFTDLNGADLRPLVAARIRADVAKTIYYRRRKGVLPMLEELARDVTGWPAHAVEFFELLGWTQHLEHLRPQSGWTDIRSIDRMDRVDGPFDEASHSVDVRHIDQLSGWHNIRNVGFFLWRLGSYPLKNVPARRAGRPWRYHFSPLGNPAPLFSRERREGDESGLATELHVPAPIRPAFFHEDLVRFGKLQAPRPDFTDLYGTSDDRSIAITRNGSYVTPEQIVCRRLDPWPAARPQGRVIALDVWRGRIAVGAGWGNATTSLDVSFHYGLSANLGGGTYRERRKWLVRPELPEMKYHVKEDGVAPSGTPPITYTSLIDAINDWESLGQRDATITIRDSRTYDLPATITLKNDKWLAIEAADGERPVLKTAPAGLSVDVLPPQPPSDPTREGTLTLNGVVVEGHLHVTGDLGRLRLLHATLVPGRRLKEDGTPDSADASLKVDAHQAGRQINTQLKVDIAFSITGALVIPEHASRLLVLDSIVDGVTVGARGGVSVSGPDGGPGPVMNVERTTIFGEARVKLLEASETIFTGKVTAERTQEGCVRFSYLTPGSTTPRRYRCQPDLAVETTVKKALERNPALSQIEKDRIRDHIQSWLEPSFTARLYGQPAYGQLHLGCPLEIRTGGEDGGEMGAFNHRKQSQRESNLRIRLQEYLPFGLDAGFIYVT